MKNLLPLFARYGVGIDKLTEDDAWEICERERITVFESPVKVACCIGSREYRCIFLPKQLKGLRRTFALWHEIGHLVLMNGQAPDVAFQGQNSKSEHEADAFALLALFPDVFIAFAESRYEQKLLNDRRRLYFLYGV